ncbi:MAG: TDT family transporter [Syntrophomonas sp.]
MGQSMQQVFRSIPVPMSGLMLALASAGSLFYSYGERYRLILGVISSIILLALVMKIIFDSQGVREDLKNPAIAGIAASFPMAIVVFSTYLQPKFSLIAYLIWLAGISIHAIFAIYYTKRVILDFHIHKIFPSCFVVYVGIAVGSLTAPVFNALEFGKILFWFAFISYLILLPVISYRVIAVKEIPEPLLPTITIFAAPASLCLAGYLNSFSDKNIVLFWLLVSLSISMLITVLFYMPKMLKSKFYPSYSAFTFPIVVSAIAIKNTNVFLTQIHIKVPFINYLVHIEELLAIIVLLYVLTRYLVFIFTHSININRV